MPSFDLYECALDEKNFFRLSRLYIASFATILKYFDSNMKRELLGLYRTKLDNCFLKEACAGSPAIDRAFEISFIIPVTMQPARDF